MGQSLGTKTWGGDDRAFEWVLQSGGNSLASGFRVLLGNGSETALFLSNTYIGVRSGGGFITKLISDATTDREIRLPDMSGLLIPSEIKRTTTNVSNSTVTPTAGIVNELDFTPQAGGIYEFEIIALMQSAAATTGVRMDLVGPAQVAAISWQARGPAASAANELSDDGFSLPAQFLGVAVPTATTPYFVRITGVFQVTGTPASPMQVQIYSEVATSQVTLLSGSIARYRKISN